MILQFGKHKGSDIRDVPLEYLEWLADSNRETLEAIEEEIERRERLEEANMPWIERLIQAGYRELAKRHHPDVGGDTNSMKEVNAAADKLRDMARTLKYTTARR